MVQHQLPVIRLNPSSGTKLLGSTLKSISLLTDAIIKWHMKATCARRELLSTGEYYTFFVVGSTHSK